jgi:hypothetical protein
VLRRTGYDGSRLLELVAIWHCVDRTEGRNGNRLAAETGILTAQNLRQVGDDDAGERQCKRSGRG